MSGTGGTFIPRNGGHEARIGAGQVFFDHTAGGVMRIIEGDRPALRTVASVDMVFRVEGDTSPAVEVRQSHDRSPQVFFLEEGGQRLGLRVLFRLYDTADVYRGFGMTETWLYPEGRMFITAAATFENAAIRQRVTEARIDITGDDVQPEGGGGTRLTMDDARTPGRSVMLCAPRAGAAGLALYWRTGAMEHDTYVRRGAGCAPYYFRWPDYFNQAHGKGRRASSLALEPGKAALIFAPPEADQPASFDALFRLARVDDAAGVRAYVEAEREPLALTVASGGVIHGNVGGYNDQEGSYEVRKTGDQPLVITLPVDERRTQVRIKAVALSGHGAVTASLDGEPLLPQLVTDGGIADDPLAPIREDPEAPADAALVTVTLGDRPRTLTIDERPGIQLTYQTRDRRRSFAVYSTHTGPRWAALRFSPIDGHARNMRSHGHAQWALTDNLMHWFSFCGYTPEQMLDQLRNFTVLRNGPDEVAFRYVSHNASDAAVSRFDVRIPNDARAMRMCVAARFEVREGWPYDGSQFFDVFPFRGVRTEEWWYPHVLWLTPDGRWKTMDTVRTSYDGDKSLQRIEGDGFFALYSSDRGNMLMLTRRFEPVLPTDYIICGNYIDYHMDIKFPDGRGKFAPPAKGFAVSCEYELALWGDASLERDRLIDIGRQSLAAGKLVLPDA